LLGLSVQARATGHAGKASLGDPPAREQRGCGQGGL